MAATRPLERTILARTPGDLDDWQAETEQSMTRFAIEPAQPSRFTGTMHVRPAAGVGLVSLAIDSHVVRREGGTGPSEDDVVVFSHVLAGGCETEQDGRRADVRPGDLCVFHSASSATVVTHEGYRSRCLVVPARRLGVSTAWFEDPGRGLVRHEQALSGPLVSVLDGLRLAVESLPPRREGQVVSAAMAFLGSIMSASDPGTEDGRHDALYSSIAAYVEDRLADPGLVPGELARAHFISTRQLYLVFESRGETPAGYIRRRRLESAHRDLVDPAQAEVSVATIASRWGFGTASHFGATFRDSYGVSPGSVRPS